MMDFLKKLFSGGKRVQKVDVAKRFSLEARTGQGSMSKVWRARDLTTGRTVAVKLLDGEKTKRFENRFKGMKVAKPSEGEIAVQLKHPNIVKTIEHGIATTDEPFLVMEYIEGTSLSYYVGQQNELMRQHRIRFMIELGEAIEHFHRQNWIHRDICPRNVMVDSELQIKLIDFGLVVPNTPPFQAPGNRTGTANYMAPELIKRQRTDQRIDIFSYAVTCYELCAGRLPWKAAETLEAVMSHINSPPDDLGQLMPDLDPQVAEAIMKGLAVRPEDRWPTIGAMLAPLREAEARRAAQAKK